MINTPATFNSTKEEFWPDKKILQQYAIQQGWVYRLCGIHDGIATIDILLDGEYRYRHITISEIKKRLKTQDSDQRGVVIIENKEFDILFQVGGPGLGKYVTEESLRECAKQHPSLEYREDEKALYRIGPVELGTVLNLSILIPSVADHIILKSLEVLPEEPTP